MPRVGRLVTEDAPLREALTREGGQITLAASPGAYAAAWAGSSPTAATGRALGDTPE